MSEPLLSLTMIVKDEEASLPTCLASVEGLVDEIVVADTGSSDGTVDVARSFGALVVDAPWEDSFAAARNSALDSASGKWAMFLDADEEFPQERRADLLELLSHGTFEALHVVIENVREKFPPPAGKASDMVPSVRIWRNRPDFRFTRRVHEDLDFRGHDEAEGFFAWSDIAIRHFGYDVDPAAMEAKSAFYERLLELALADDPLDVVTLLHLGRSHDRRGASDQALEFYKRAVAADDAQLYPVTRRHLVASLAQNGEYHRAATSARVALRVFPDYADLWYYLGRVQLELGEPENALGSLRKAGALSRGHTPYPSLFIRTDAPIARAEAEALDALGRGAGAAGSR